jgi:hypothetical protein
MPPRPSLRRSVGLGVALFAIYCANGREIGSGDTQPSVVLPLAVLRGDGFTLDRYRALWPWASHAYYLADRRGHLVSRFPIGPGAITVPFVAPQLWVLDAVEPDWEADPVRAMLWARRMSKHASAALAALTGVAIDRTLLALGLGACALPATLIATLGSSLWMTASQSPWQHGPATFALAATLALLLPPPAGRGRLVAAGGTTALIAFARPGVGFLSVLIALWAVQHYRQRALWFFVVPPLIAAPLVAWNAWYFGHPLGGYHELMQMVGNRSHAVEGYWDANFREALPGTLFSPSRGLFVFSPWVPLSLLTLPAIWPRLRQWSLVGVLLLAGLPLLMLETLTQSTWWAGWSFGARFWTDLMPVFAIVLGCALAWARERAPAYFGVLLTAGAVAIALQAIGAVTFPSTFNYRPNNVDRNHERLWSWRDGEIMRGLREGRHPWE